MSVILFSSKDASVLAWAFHVALRHTQLLQWEPDDPSTVEVAGVRVEYPGPPRLDEEYPYANVGRNDFLAAARLVANANIATYNLRYAEKVGFLHKLPLRLEVPERLVQAATVRFPERPLAEAAAAYTVLYRYRYNIYSEAVGGEDARELLRRAMSAIAFGLLYVEGGWA